MLSAINESASVINSADEEGWVPLHSAASIGHSEIVEVLLSRGISYFLLEVVFVIIIPHAQAWIHVYVYNNTEKVTYRYHLETHIFPFLIKIEFI